VSWGKINVSFAHSILSDLKDVLEFYRKQKVPHVGSRSKMAIDIMKQNL
jgi:hypothetical protein